MKKDKMNIIEIEEVGYPNCLIMRQGSPISELIKTEHLIDELFTLLIAYRDRALRAEKTVSELNKAYEGYDF